MSGPGSRIGVTKSLRKSLEYLIKLFNIKTLIDAPCGDMNWISQMDFQGINYLGFDIVGELVEKNQKKFENYSNITVEKKDILNEPIPCSDLILCRDLIIHFPIESIYSLIRNFILSESKYLLITQHVILDPKFILNKQIEFGKFSYRNLTKPPFNFPNPLFLIPEDSFDRRSERFLAFYELAELKKYL